MALFALSVCACGGDKWLDIVAEDLSVAEDLRRIKGKVIDPVNFTPLTVQGILPKEFALELVRSYKEVIAPRFDPATKVMMFGSYAKGCPNEWSDIDVAVIVPKIKEGTWWDTSSSLCRDVDKVSLYIEPILLESGEDSPIYREMMRTGVSVLYIM